MEDLTKTQLILLALLVSFVASIATSIATASLYEQAPPGITQTVTRVVERTVETVSPEDNGSPTVTQEKTVIVREEDAITNAIAKVSPSLIQLYLAPSNKEEKDDGSSGQSFRGIAVPVGEPGELITLSSAVFADAFGEYQAVLPDGSAVRAIVENRDGAYKSTRLKLIIADDDAPPHVVFASTDGLRLGQTAVGLSGAQSVSVAIGIISNLETNTAGEVTAITTSFRSAAAGMPIINLFGEVVGFAHVADVDTFVPAAPIFGS